jgi:hypothetical protein
MSIDVAKFKQNCEALTRRLTLIQQQTLNPCIYHDRCHMYQKQKDCCLNNGVLGCGLYKQFQRTLRRCKICQKPISSKAWSMRLPENKILYCQSHLQSLRQTGRNQYTRKLNKKRNLWGFKI